MKHAILALASLVAAASAGPAAAAPRKPNVVVILVDDFGYECLGVNGGKSYRTPNVDRLARAGVRFEHCYAQPNCTPTRVQLLSGMSNVRNYVGFGTMDKSVTTFANLFSKAGYATCIAGKWQLGAREAGLPRHFGFDEHCLWSYMGRGDRYANPTLTVNGQLKTYPGKYGPDITQEFALDFVRRHKDKPFLLYYPMILVHGHYEPTPDGKDYGRPQPGKAAGQRYFAEMVAYMDKQVGALEKELAALGLLDDTLVLFTGDNGTGRSVSSETEGGAQDGEKGNTTRAGMRVPLVASWPKNMAAGTVCKDLVDMTDFLPTVCEAAGVAVPKDLKPDGRSFLSQVRGQKGQPREWVYSYWVPLKERQAGHIGARGAVEQAFDHRFKLYSTGAFYDLGRDPDEKKPLRVADLAGEAAAAARKLQAALDQFKGARPSALPAPRPPKKKGQ